MRLKLAVLAALVAASAAACGRSDGAVPQPMPSPATSQGATPMPDAQSQHMVEAARTQLAASLNLPPTSISVVQVEKVEWPDSSLGCAQPGQMALQVITPGYRIELSANGKSYQFHTDTQRVVIPCDKGGGGAAIQ